MSYTSIARRYANALLDLSENEDQAREILEALEVASESLSCKEAQIALESPALEQEDRALVLKDLSDAMKLPEKVGHFLQVLLQAGRFSALRECSSLLRQLFEERYGVRIARVESAAELDEDTQAKLKERLEKNTGYRIELEIQENADLLAGWRARVGNQLIEADLRSQLGRLRERVMKG